MCGVSIHAGVCNYWIVVLLLRSLWWLVKWVVVVTLELVADGLLESRIVCAKAGVAFTLTFIDPALP